MNILTEFFLFGKEKGDRYGYRDEERDKKRNYGICVDLFVDVFDLHASGEADVEHVEYYKS